MHWERSTRADARARRLADRHYSRQKIGAQQFVPPGRCLVLYTRTTTGQAYWVTSWPFPQYVKHRWAGAWMCSAFRNEGAAPAVTLIRQAVAATLDFYGMPPQQGMVTFIDPRHVRPTMVRGTPTWGWTFLKAGFEFVGTTVDQNLLAFQLPPDRMPIPSAALQAGALGDLFGEALDGYGQGARREGRHD